MKILITSGGTREYIDDVRVLTNLSSGRLGAVIADEAVKLGHDVVYLHGVGAVMPGAAYNSAIRTIHHPTDKEGREAGDFFSVGVKDTAALMEKMAEWVPRAQAVIHAMAVSDFTFDRENPVKLKSNDAEGFIEYMRANIQRTPKVIQKIKDWNPDVYLVGFKFEVGLAHEELAKIAEKAMEANRADAVLANDKAEMVREGEHIGWLYTRSVDGCWESRYDGKKEIARGILGAVEEWWNDQGGTTGNLG